MKTSILDKKQKTNSEANSESCSVNQMATWIHPENIRIYSNSFTNRAAKITTANRWNSSATSLQYLNEGQKGSIEFKVPKKTTQVFYIGFSNGCIDSSLQTNFFGVRLSQNGPGANNLMAVDIFVKETQVDPRTQVVNPGDVITLTLEGATCKIYVSKRLVRSLTLDYIKYPAVAEVSFKRPGHIENVQLVGEWNDTPIGIGN